jgi:probable HAF family extracellular repeat protein
MWSPMSLRSLFSAARLQSRRRQLRKMRDRHLVIRPQVERLEDRRCPSSAYSIIDLGTLGGPTSVAWGINNASQNSAQVTGTASTGVADYYHAFLWTQGNKTGVAGNRQMQDLGALPGMPYSGGRALNNSGQVVGEALAANVQVTATDAFLWTPGGTNGVPSNPQMQDLGALANLAGSPADAVAYAVNNAVNNGSASHSVQVVGQSEVGGFGVYDAFLWQDGIMTDLNSPSIIPANSGWVLNSATGINDMQQIVGVGLFNGVQHGFLAQIGATTTGSSEITAIADLGAVGYPQLVTGLGLAINQAGDVVGGPNPFLFANGTRKSLPIASAAAGVTNLAVAINVADQAVGYSASILYEAAFLWQNGKVTDLTSQLPNKSGWRWLWLASGISDAGLIVGQGELNSTVNHAFLMTPVAKPSAALLFTPHDAALADASILAIPLAQENGTASLELDAKASPRIQAALPGLLTPSASLAPHKSSAAVVDLVFSDLTDLPFQDIIAAILAHTPAA